MIRSSIHIHRMEGAGNTPMSSASPDTSKHNLEEVDSDFAFLVHSQDTLSQQAGPDIDDQRLARQKRRRTRQESCNI